MRSVYDGRVGGWLGDCKCYDSNDNIEAADKATRLQYLVNAIAILLSNKCSPESMHSIIR